MFQVLPWVLTQGGNFLVCMWGVSNLGLGGCSGLEVLIWALLHLSSSLFAFWTSPSFFLLFPCSGNECSDPLMLLTCLHGIFTRRGSGGDVDEAHIPQQRGGAIYR